MSGIHHFGCKIGEKVEKTIKSIDFVEKYRQNYKNLNLEMQKEILFYYILHKSENGLYKKESNRNLGEYFGVGKDTISNRLKQLTDSKHIVTLSEFELKNTYKILKGDYNDV